MSFEAKLAELKITLPPAPKPVASYVPAVQAGDLLFLSGTGPFKDGKIVFAGKLGKDLTVEQGYEAAKLTILNALAIYRWAACWESRCRRQLPPCWRAEMCTVPMRVYHHVPSASVPSGTASPQSLPRDHFPSESKGPPIGGMRRTS